MAGSRQLPAKVKRAQIRAQSFLIEIQRENPHEQPSWLIDVFG
jgi:hypothetical protein